MIESDAGICHQGRPTRCRSKSVFLKPRAQTAGRGSHALAQPSQVPFRGILHVVVAPVGQGADHQVPEVRRRRMVDGRAPVLPDLDAHARSASCAPGCWRRACAVRGMESRPRETPPLETRRCCRRTCGTARTCPSHRAARTSSRARRRARPRRADPRRSGRRRRGSRGVRRSRADGRASPRREARRCRRRAADPRWRGSRRGS